MASGEQSPLAFFRNQPIVQTNKEAPVMKRVLGLILALTGGIVMAKQSQPTHLLDGSWASPQLRLTMGATGGEIEMGCASGIMKGPIKLAKDGSFSASGTFEQHQGGPQHVDEDAPASHASHAARFRGTVAGDTMSLSILSAGARTPEKFQLRKGARLKIIRCL